jgi:drug/metabolite transporter (DMT)-like permease
MEGEPAGVELWVITTIFAAAMQAARTAWQKQLTGALGINGATFARFLYGFPIALIYILILSNAAGLQWPAPNLTFLGYCLVGGIAQIFATSLLIHLFTLSNFAVGTTYSKTEAVQTAIFGIVILGEPPSAAAFVAIIISVIGVFFLSLSPGRITGSSIWSAWTGRAAVVGLSSGALFGVSAVSIRAAALSLGVDGFMMPAALTLVTITALQTVIMGAYMFLRERDNLMAVVRVWRSAALVGLLGVAGSAGWFTAMTLQNAAYVRTLGQVELVFTFIASRFFFRERIRLREAIGILLIVGGILVLLQQR